MGHPINQLTDFVFKVSPATGRLEGRWPNGDRPGIFVGPIQQQQQSLVNVGVPVANWQLPLTNIYSRNYDMRVCAPRPDSETGVLPGDTTAKYAWGVHLPGKTYREPIEVFGGSAPFLFEIISGPPGMYTPSDRNDPDYGFIVWPAAQTTTPGAYTVTIRVSDQQYNRTATPSVRETITFTINNDAALWVQLRTGNAVTPTTASTLNDILKASATDSTYLGKAVWMENVGTDYVLIPPTGTDEMPLTNKPKIFKSNPALPIAVINMQQGYLSVGNYGQVYAHFAINGTCATSYNTFGFFCGGFSTQNRMTFRIQATGGVRGTAVQADNPAIVHTQATDPIRVDCVMCDSSITQSTVPLLDAYSWSGVVERIYGYNNIYSSGGDGQCILLKGGNQFVSVRYAKGRAITGNNFIYLVGAYNLRAQKEIEVVYADVFANDNSANCINTGNAGAEGPNDGPRPLYIVRSTTRGVIYQWNNQLTNVTVKDCVVISNTQPQIDSSAGNKVYTVTGCIAQVVAIGVTNSENQLQGFYLQYLGQKGYQISG